MKRCVLFALPFLLPAASFGEVIISEIMYNPASKEQPGAFAPGGETQRQPNRVEWVEIYNSSDAAVELAGYKLADEDGETSTLPAGATLLPRQAAVIIPRGLRGGGVSDGVEAGGERRSRLAGRGVGAAGAGEPRQQPQREQRAAPPG